MTIIFNYAQHAFQMIWMVFKNPFRHPIYNARGGNNVLKSFQPTPHLLWEKLVDVEIRQKVCLKKVRRGNEEQHFSMWKPHQLNSLEVIDTNQHRTPKTCFLFRQSKYDVKCFWGIHTLSHKKGNNGVFQALITKGGEIHEEAWRMCTLHTQWRAQLCFTQSMLSLGMKKNQWVVSLHAVVVWSICVEKFIVLGVISAIT